MRETGEVADAKKVQLMTNLSNLSRREVRYTTGGSSYPQQFPSNQRYWLRITRTSNQFVGYVSPNGQTWYQVMAVTVDMNTCIEVGLVVTNYQPISMVNATFANVNISGSGSALAMPDENQDLVQEDIESPNFNLFPNPTTGELNLDLTQYLNKTVRIEVWSVEGSLLQFIKLEELQTTLERLDLSAYDSGTYLIRVKAEGLPDVTKRVVLYGDFRP